MYDFYSEGNRFFFFTKSNALYAVKIELDNEILSKEFSDERLRNDFYEISFNIIDGKVDLKDTGISETIVAIAKAWISAHNKILFFICSSEDRTAKARMRLFEVWAKSQSELVEFAKHILIEKDQTLSDIGTMIRLDHEHLEYFNDARDQVVNKLNSRK